MPRLPRLTEHWLRIYTTFLRDVKRAVNGSKENCSISQTKSKRIERFEIVSLIVAATASRFPGICYVIWPICVRETITHRFDLKSARFSVRLNTRPFDSLACFRTFLRTVLKNKIIIKKSEIPPNLSHELNESASAKFKESCECLLVFFLLSLRVRNDFVSCRVFLRLRYKRPKLFQNVKELNLVFNL